jgi:hypothetical protein
MNVKSPVSFRVPNEKFEEENKILFQIVQRTCNKKILASLKQIKEVSLKGLIQLFAFPLSLTITHKDSNLSLPVAFLY